MTTLSRENKPNPTRTLFHSNPVLTRMSKITERSDTHAASYAGISAKTCYFLLVTLAGMIVQLLVKASLSAEPVWQTGTPERKGRYFASILIRDTRRGDSVSEHRAEWDGECWWLYQMKLREEFSVLSWWPLPEKFTKEAIEG